MSDLVERLRSEFLPAILHGDAEHRAWLTAAVEAFIAGEPVPTPIGSGTKEARIEALEAAIAPFSGIIGKNGDPVTIKIGPSQWTDVVTTEDFARLRDAHLANNPFYQEWKKRESETEKPLERPAS